MIRILGAGVSGLTAAVALARDGPRVELIDESLAIPSVGTARGLFAPEQRVLEQMGALEPVRRRAAMPREGHLLSAGGQVLATVPAGGGLLVSRSDLVSILHDALPASVRCRRERISDVRPLREDAELLIGADGTHSLVRRSGWPGTAARSHHVTVLRGTAEIPPPRVSVTCGRGWLFGITPLPVDRSYLFACFPYHRIGSRTADLVLILGALGGAHPAIGAVLEAARP